MKKLITCTCFFLSFGFSHAQDFSFTFVKTFTDEKEIVSLYDSIKKPLLIFQNKIYAIGSDCTNYSLLDGTFNQRNKDGKTSRRNKGGKNDQRFSDGDTDQRLAGGDIGERNKSGKSDKRRKGGKSDRRNKGGNSDDRNSGGTLSNAPRCEVSDNGKLVLYTRQEIKSKNAQIYYKHQFFNKKYFKINTL